MRLSLILWMGMWSLLACQGKTPSKAAEPPEKKETAVEPKSPKPATDEAGESKPGEDQIATEKGIRLVGKLNVVDKEGGEGAPADGKLELTIDEEKRVQGIVELEGKKFDIGGFQKDSDLRLWMATESDDPEEVRRGYLFGKTEGEGYRGEFAFSGNGGEPAIRGTWTAAKPKP